MKSKIYILYFVLFILQQSTKAADEKTSSSTPPQKTKIDVLKSDLCKKCTCGKFDEVYELDCTQKLPNKWLTDDEWSIMQNGNIFFQTIILEKNNITYVPQFPEYPVKNLYLGFNKIEKIALEAFKNLTKLTKLDLSHNLLSTKALQPDVFKGYYAPGIMEPEPLFIKDLNLGHNDLHSLNADLFEHIPNLENLTLTQNIFQTIDAPTIQAISSLNSLKSLDMSYLEINELPHSFLHANRDVETLILSGNLFTKIPSELAFAKNLVYLNMDDNPIKEISGKNIFPELKKLTTLSISYMPDLVLIGNGAFQNLQSLEVLYAADNLKLSFIESKAFEKSTPLVNIYDYCPLKELYLNNNNLSIVHHSWVVRWDKVNIIDLRYNPLQCDCNNVWLIDNLIFQKSSMSNFVKNVQCGWPANLKGYQIDSFHKEQREIICDESSNVLLILCLTGFVIFTVSLVGFILYRRGYLNLRNRCFNRNETSYTQAIFSENLA